MSLRPPDPTTNHLSHKEEAARMRRGAMIPVGIGLAVVLILAGFSAYNKAGEIRLVPYQTGDMAISEFSSPYTPEQSTLFDQLTTTNTSLEGLLQLRPDDSALPHEPANLPEHPQGRRLAGLQRPSGQVIEEIAFWKVDMSNPAQALAHYLDAAADQNFVAIPRRHSPDSAAAGVISHVMMRQPSDKKKDVHLPVANDLLILRARATEDGQVMITIWYRYASVIHPGVIHHP